MKLPIKFALVGLIFGVIILILFPQVLDITLNYTVSTQNTIDSSNVGGSPYALAVTALPLVGALIGFTIGFLITKIKGKNKGIPNNI